MRVRRATPDDLPWLLAEARAFAASYDVRARGLYPGDAHATRVLLGLLQGQYLAIAEWAHGERLGFLAGVAAPHWLNPDITLAQEILWWVTPTARGTGAGRLLLDDFLAWGRTVGQQITVTVELHEPQVGDVLRRRGFLPRESAWLLEVDP